MIAWICDASTGRAKRQVNCDAELIALQAGAGEIIHRGDLDPATQRLDATGAVVAYTPPPPSLADARTAARAALRAACRAAILAGFESSALGSPHQYPFTLEYQSNLQGAILAAMNGAPGWTTTFLCGRDGDWQRRTHTAAQIIHVGQDGKAHFTALLDRLDRAEAAVQTASDPAGVTL